MSAKKPLTKYLKDYLPPAFLVNTVDLSFDLHEDHCKVKSLLFCQSNPDFPSTRPQPFVCQGRNLELTSISLNGQLLEKRNKILDEETLTINKVPAEFRLEIETLIEPQNNTSLEGLYQSGDLFCTQCEAQGFRKITFFPDRPDVMSRYSCRIEADREKYPVLLSNGNMMEKGELENNRHWVRWQDPFKKPSYLFALVAGDLLFIEDIFVTRSGRSVKLQIFVEKKNIDKCEHAMLCLKQSMKWDEDNYDREYDLDIFMIVAVDDFNAGAMENKGLNIFNSSYVLARPETATDSDFDKIRGVIAHEYFHNWTGNRITCRDWFQLSLKEGLTIFRDQQFSADMTSSTTKRIDDVRVMRTIQFAEDSGPMSHQVRPDSYIEINNFYTVTIYQKGAELIRMIHILLGKEGFHKGMELYFRRHDGQAITTEDFVKAMEEASGVDLGQFRRWYTQAGTPEVDVKTEYSPNHQTFTVTLRQSCPSTSDQKNKLPFHIPLVMGLLDQNGQELTLHEQDQPNRDEKKNLVLNLKKTEEKFCFNHIPDKPLLSILRGFSAPVKINRQISDKELIFLMSHDSDDFNRWEAAQQLMARTTLELVKAYQQNSGKPQSFEEKTSQSLQGLLEAFGNLLQNKSLDRAFVAQSISWPSEIYLAEQVTVVDVEAIHHTRETVMKKIATALRQEFLRIYEINQDKGKYRIDARSVGRRSLKNQALNYLMRLDDPEVLQLCTKQLQTADNMTDEKSALTYLANKDCPMRSEALEAFYQKWQHDPLVLNTWFSIQASSKLTSLDQIEKLMLHPAFEFKNPNKIRALIGTFCVVNLINFHAPDGAGYEFLANQVLELDSANPQIAARLLTPLTRWKKYNEHLQKLIKAQIKRVLKTSNISRDVYEIASRCLKSG